MRTCAPASVRPRKLRICKLAGLKSNLYVLAQAIVEQPAGECWETIDCVCSAVKIASLSHRGIGDNSCSGGCANTTIMRLFEAVLIGGLAC